MKPDVFSTAPSCARPCNQCQLRQRAAFKPIDPDQLAFIESFRECTVTVAAGQQIIGEHRTSHKLFTIYDGWAFRYKTLSDGRRQILNFLLPGDFIGLQEEFVDGSTHGVEAVTEVSLCVFPRDGLWELFRKHPQLGYDVTWLASREEGMVDENLLSAGRRSAPERVATLLVHLYRRAERVGLAADGAIDFPFNQQHIADALGLSLVHTNKTLRRLRRVGLYELDNGRLRIQDLHAIENLADYYDRPLRAVPLI